jgi:hypothetical protein
VHAVHARATAFGARIHAGPHPFEVTGADGAKVRMPSPSLGDTGGCFVEINERH